MSHLVEIAEFAKAIGRPESSWVSKILYKASGLPEMNKAYSQNAHLKGKEFIDAILGYNNVQPSYLGSSLENVPKSDGLVVVCNHPFGGIDGLLALQMMLKVRPDTKVMANFLLQKIEPLKEFVLGVNPFDSNISDRGSEGGIRSAIKHVKTGGCLIIFPAGEVATGKGKTPSDKAWKPSVIRLIRELNASILPVFFVGRNSKEFYAMSKISPKLRSLMLPRELIKKRNCSINMVIGECLSPLLLKGISDQDLVGRILRARLISLERIPQIEFNSGNDTIQEYVLNDWPNLRSEIDSLSQYKITEQGDFECYLLRYNHSALVMHEVGRLREIAFRQVGEGTMKEIDLDEFDQRYQHLVLWNKRDGHIAGAYRAGIGPEIVTDSNANGLYVSTLFRFDKSLLPVLKQCIELGRSFVSPEYQRHRLPLGVLWDGIRFIMRKHVECKFIIGPVSISNGYHRILQGLMTQYLKHHYSDEIWSDKVIPYNPLEKSIFNGLEDFKELTKLSLAEFDKVISAIDPMGRNLPVLIKRYISQHARVLGFNRDLNFANSIDVLMMSRIENIK
jgi:putative hemolysin